MTVRQEGFELSLFTIREEKRSTLAHHLTFSTGFTATGRIFNCCNFFVFLLAKCLNCIINNESEVQFQPSQCTNCAIECADTPPQ